MKIKIEYFILINIIVLNIQNCVIINELLPKTPTKSVHVSNIIQIEKERLIPQNQIAMEYFYINGFEEPHTPSLTNPTPALKNFLLEANNSIELNRSGIIRFYNTEHKKGKVKKIIILVTGIYSGGGTVSNLGYSISRRLDNSEVWIWERRSNLLEDRRILKKVINEKNTHFLTNLLKSDKFTLKEKSFYQPSKEDIEFVGYWGLNVLLNDLLSVIIAAKERSDEVILAGYSLGVSYVTMFLANNFINENKTIAGHSIIDKAILLDGPPMINGYIKNEFDYQNGVTIMPYNIIEGKKSLNPAHTTRVMQQ